LGVVFQIGTREKPVQAIPGHLARSTGTLLDHCKNDFSVSSRKIKEKKTEKGNRRNRIISIGDEKSHTIKKEKEGIF